MTKVTKSLAFFILLAVIAVSCKKEENEIEIVNREIYNLFEEVYFWYEHLPSSADPGGYGTPQEFVDAIKHKDIDRFSFVMDKDEFLQYFEQGQSFGHGFFPGVDPNGNIRIAFVYENTSAYEKGVRRTWIVREINDERVTPSNFYQLIGPRTEQVTNDILFVAPDGTEKEISLTKELVEINTVLHDEIIEIDGTKVGYIVFQDFIGTAIDEINDAFGNFQENNIEELIIDLRYNGGGSIAVAEHIADWILGSRFSGKPFFTLKHNDKRSSRDTTATIEMLANGQGLNLERVVFITTGNTASASEMLLNGFKPYLTTVSVGTPTYGKPVGMETYVFNEYSYAVLPITFKYVNADDEGDFYDGINPDVFKRDDLTRTFGDPEETLLETSLNYISTGTISQKKQAAGPVEVILPDNGKGIHQFLRSF